jgi:hypothetical protein
LKFCDKQQSNNAFTNLQSSPAACTMSKLHHIIKSPSIQCFVTTTDCHEMETFKEINKNCVRFQRKNQFSDFFKPRAIVSYIWVLYFYVQELLLLLFIILLSFVFLALTLLHYWLEVIFVCSRRLSLNVDLTYTNNDIAESEATRMLVLCHALLQPEGLLNAIMLCNQS